MSTTSERLAAGARPLGSAVPPMSGGGTREPAVRRVTTLMTVAERCADCRYPDRCASDSTCWDQERDVGREITAYRRKERGLELGVGDGLAAGIKVTLPREPHAAGRRLLDTLGADWEVDETLEERAAVGDSAVTGSADHHPGDPVRAAPSSNAARSITNPYGLKKRGRGYAWTVDAAVQAVRDYHAKHGHPPSYEALAISEDPLPSRTSLKLLGLSLGDLIEQAGLDRPGKGARYSSAPADPPPGRRSGHPRFVRQRCCKPGCGRGATLAYAAGRCAGRPGAGCEGTFPGSALLERRARRLDPGDTAAPRHRRAHADRQRRRTARPPHPRGDRP